MPPGIVTRPRRPPALSFASPSRVEVTGASRADVTAYMRKRQRNPEDIYYEDPMAGPDTRPLLPLLLICAALHPLIENNSALFASASI